MPTLYFSLNSPGSESMVQNLVAECESFMEAQCLLKKDHEPLAKETIRDSLGRCDALIVVMGSGKTTSGKSSPPGGEAFLNERVRFEIVSAMNLDLMIVPLLIGDAALPPKENAPGALKRLLDCKTYRIREALWFEDLHDLLEDIQGELDFKREVENKLSKSAPQNFPGRADFFGKPAQPQGLGMGYSGAMELQRMIDSEKLVLKETRRKGDRRGERNSLAALGMAFTQLGQTQRAIQYFEEQLEIVREIGDAEETCALLANLGDAFAISGNIDRAKTYYQEQLLLADSRGRREFVGSAYNGLGHVYVKRNDISRAVDCYHKALAIYRELENHDKELELRVGIGLNYQKLGKLELMAEQLEAALKTACFLENRREEARILVDLGEAYFHLGFHERVGPYLNRAEEILTVLKEPWAVSWKNRIKNIKNALSRN